MRRGIASLICFFAHCESSVDWRRLTGRHPAPHSMFFLFYVLYFLCGCIVSLNPEITCIRRCGRAGGVTSTEQTTILPTSTSGLFFAQTYKGRAFVRPFLFVPPERHSLCALSLIHLAAILKDYLLSSFFRGCIFFSTSSELVTKKPVGKNSIPSDGCSSCQCFVVAIV